MSGFRKTFKGQNTLFLSSGFSDSNETFRARFFSSFDVHILTTITEKWDKNIYVLECESKKFTHLHFLNQHTL